MDNPAGLPEGVGGCRRDGSLLPLILRRRGSMGGRQVSATPKALQVPPMRASRPAGTAGGTVAVHAGIRSRAVVAGPEASSGLVPPTRPGLQGASSAAPRSTEQAADFLSASCRLRYLRRCCSQLRRADAVKDIDKTLNNARRRIEYRLRHFGGDENELEQRPFGTTRAEQAYRILLDMARGTRETSGLANPDQICRTLQEFDWRVDAELNALIAKHGLTEVSPGQPAPALPTAATTAVATTALAAATPLQAETKGVFDWIGAIRQLQHASDCFRRARAEDACRKVQAARDQISKSVKYRFNALGGKTTVLPAQSPDVLTRPEQHYRAIEAMYRQARDANDCARTGVIIDSLNKLHDLTASALRKLTDEWGPLENLSIQAALPGPPPPMTDAENRVLTGPLNPGSGTLPPATPGDAGRPDDSAFISAMHSLLEHKRRHTSQGNRDEAHKFKRAYNRLVQYVKRRYQALGGQILQLEGDGHRGRSKVEQIYLRLKQKAQEVNDQPTLDYICAILVDFDTRAVAELQALTCNAPPNCASSTQGIQQPPATAAPAVMAPTFQAHSSTPGPSNRTES